MKTLAFKNQVYQDKNKNSGLMPLGSATNMCDFLKTIVKITLLICFNLLFINSKQMFLHALVSHILYQHMDGIVSVEN